MGSAILRGYYGRQNVGDDAFLAVSAWGANKFCGCNDIMAAAGRIPQTYGYSVRPLYSRYSFRGISLINQITEHWYGKDIGWNIFGGGSNFHTESYIKHLYNQIRRCPTSRCFAAGISVGPFKNSAAEVACAKLLNSMEFIGVRDKVSYERARSIAPNARVKLTFDLAPLLLKIFNKESLHQERKGLGIALCNYERFTNGNIEREAKRSEIIADVIRKCISEALVNEVTFIDFNGHKTMGDYRVHLKLENMLKNCVKVKHFLYTDDSVKVMHTVAGLKGIIAMRLHAAVFGFCTDTPVLMLGYHEKCREWADMIGMPPTSVLDASQFGNYELKNGIHELLLNKYKPNLSSMKAVEMSMANWNWITG